MTADAAAIALAAVVPSAWLLVCAVANRFDRREQPPAVTNPGREARLALTAPQPVPTGRHRSPWKVNR